MKVKGILFVVVVLVFAAGLAIAADKPAAAAPTSTVAPQESKLGVTLDVAYVTRFIWRGFDMYPEHHSAIQPAIDLDLWGSGFGVSAYYSRANSSGFENCAWLPGTLYYYNALFKDEPYQTNFKVGWTYYNYPSRSYRDADLQEIFGGFAWPKLLPGLSLVPRYTAVRMWPAHHGSQVSDIGGWAHIFGLDYGLALPAVMPNTTEQIINLSAETVYNDGVGPGCASAGFSPGMVDHDWSHAVFGISSSFEVSKNLFFTPGFYYQSSWDDSVNPSDEHWVSLKMTYKF